MTKENTEPRFYLGIQEVDIFDREGNLCYSFFQPGELFLGDDILLLDTGQKHAVLAALNGSDYSLPDGYCIEYSKKQQVLTVNGFRFMKVKAFNRNPIELAFKAVTAMTKTDLKQNQ